MSLSPTFLGDLAKLHATLRSQSTSRAFLTDLTQVYESVRPQSLSSAFFTSLERVHATLPTASDANLRLLADHLDEWRRVTQDFVCTRRKELSDDDPLLCPISLFRTMDYGRLEVAHTRTLAWLLDPTKNDEHGFGDALLAALLGKLAGRDQFDHLHVSRVASEYALDGSLGEGRLDILAEGEWESKGESVLWTLVIEAKVGAWEGDGQLEKYNEWLRFHASNRTVYRVFLTPDGRNPETGAEEWESLSYLELVRIFRAVYVALREAPGFHFLRFYLAGVLQDVCHLPRNMGEHAPDPYAVASYLKTVNDS